ncbi:MAG: peptidylprolyl isomerase [Candidatus Euphemobacter frigidus]|nr:peptidylprolyl isomerase [Candidatus Euphemobacter frigidus]MDP8276549.1 peptidylprolyl isomerase [Candidatus Euphemobacter frigidus]
MKRSIGLLLIVLAGGWVLSGCGDKEKEKESAPIADLPSSQETVAPTAMVADVNGTVVTGAMLNQQIAAMRQQYAMRVPPEQMSRLQPMLRQQAVASLVNQELLFQKAEREEIEPDKEKVDEEIEKIAARFPSREQFEQQLARAGVTDEALRRDIARNLKIQLLIDKQLPPKEELEASEEEVEKFYNENPRNFEQPEQVGASHILIKFSPEDTTEQKEEKRRKLAEIEKQIDEGADFAELARENSQDIGSAEKGGELGYFPRGRMIKPFEETAFAMGTGEVSEIVETQFGYHLIKVTGRKEAGVIPLEEVEEEITSFLTSQKRQQIIDEYLQKLRSDARIEYGEDFKPIPPPPINQYPPPQLPK